MPDPTSPVASLDSGAYRNDPDNIITVYFVPKDEMAEYASQTTDPQADITSEGWTQTEIERVMAALATISNYIDLTFQVSDSSTADFQLVLDNDELNDDNLLGYFYMPGSPGYTGQSMGVFNANASGWTQTGLQAGGLGYSTIIHEALHGLGLDHPHDGDTILRGLNPSLPDYPFDDYGDFGLNQDVYTIMSYNAGHVDYPYSDDFGSAMGPMALDIAMLQEAYGANTTHEDGNSTYVLPDIGSGWLAIWDTGGIDEITYAGIKDITIDLRAATLQYEVGGGGFISAAFGVAGGYTIANGVVIENATGGSGNDTLIGNAAANTLTGNGGDDTLRGGAKGDTINGGDGNDTAFGGTGDDTIDGGGNDDTLWGNSGSDSVSATGGINTINGNSGADTLTGGSGSDTIYGNSGDDIISGSASGDFLFGGRGNDTLIGGDGQDTLNGGMGQDELTGGAQADTFVFDFVSDSWAGRADTITDFGDGADLIDLSGIDGSTAFTFRNSGAFTGAGHEIRLSESGGSTTIQIDRDGDTTAEMEIFVTGVIGLTVDDFIL